MGRNPVVGRQGPAHHAATIPDENEAPSGWRSSRSAPGIGHAATMRRTLEALGLPASPADDRGREQRRRSAGMLFKVRHLVEVTPAQEA